MDKKQELLNEEDQRFAEFDAELDRIPEHRMAEPGVTPEWSVKDVIAHMGSWMAEAARMLERIRMGTYERQKLDVEARNVEFHEAWRDASIHDVKAEWYSARTRMLEEWAALAEVTPAAESWFRESGPAHVDEHLADLRAFADRVQPDRG